MDELHATARGFDEVADAYERSRPSYPRAALDVLVHDLGIADGRTVLELGAGTGKLTRLLVDRGAHVVAVEPLPAMRAELARRVPAARVLAGSAEAIPLPDAGDHREPPTAAVAAQAFHWFDAEAAFAELHRVLPLDSWFAVLFNRRDLADAGQAAIDELLLPFRGDTPSWGSDAWRDDLREPTGFRVTRRAAFAHTQQLDRAGLRARVASVSFVAQLDTASRDALAEQVDRRFAELASDGRVALAYVTELTVMRRTAT